MPPVKFQIAWDSFGLNQTTQAHLWDALCRSGHPLAKCLWWTFVREEARRSSGFARRLAAVWMGHTPQEWSAMLEHLVNTERLTRPEANAVLECVLSLTNAGGQWR